MAIFATKFWIMIVLKFGGTSVGNAVNIKKVSDIIYGYSEPKIVVLSAVAGTTNSLVAINEAIANLQPKEALKRIDALEQSYLPLLNELFSEEQFLNKAGTFLQNQFNHLRSLSGNIVNEKEILAQGELISTNLFQIYQEELGRDSALIPALDYMAIDAHGEPVSKAISAKLDALIKRWPKTTTFITQGYICLNNLGEIDNLKRGGSDYSASLIGAAIKASEIQIWTDIDGMHNNDPRYVENTFSIDEMSFDEAAELAYFGAKILHPQSIIPAQKNNIPVLLKNTFNPSDKGTLIRNGSIPTGVRAIAAKDGITAIKIKSYRMLMAYGFLKKIFEIFEKYHTAIDMITTSEVAVSLTIDNTKNLRDILEELGPLGKIEVDSNMSIICLAGDFDQDGKGISAQVINCLKEVPLRMISYGGSNYNMSLLIATDDKIRSLKLLNEGLFEKRLLEATGH